MVLARHTFTLHTGFKRAFIIYLNEIKASWLVRMKWLNPQHSFQIHQDLECVVKIHVELEMFIFFLTMCTPRMRLSWSLSLPFFFLNQLLH